MAIYTVSIYCFGRRRYRILGRCHALKQQSVMV